MPDVAPPIAVLPFAELATSRKSPPARPLYGAPLVHHRLRFIPPPREKDDRRPPDLASMGRMLPSFLAMEVRRSPEGALEFALATPGSLEMSRLSAGIRSFLPHCRVEEEVACPMEDRSLASGRFGRAVVRRTHHHWPLNVVPEVDAAALLVNLLASPAMKDHELVLQVLTRPVDGWEAPFYSSKFDKLDLSLQGKHYPLFGEPWERAPTESEKDLHRRVTERRRERACHTEMRAWVQGPAPQIALDSLNGWLSQWGSVNGGTWWHWKPVQDSVLGRHRVERFHEAFVSHNLKKFSNRKERRNISATELVAVLPLPWKDHHPELPYTESAPRTPPPPPRLSAVGLAPRPSPVAPKPRPTTSSNEAWEPAFNFPNEVGHAAILGASGMGKSTLLAHLVDRVLWRDPCATVVVLDPAGTLVHDLKRTIASDALHDTVEFDPSDLIYEEKGVDHAAPGFNLVHLPREAGEDPAEAERLAGIVASDLVKSFQNVWGQESVGARASYFLGALTRGLFAKPGSNLLDVREIIVDKAARERFVRNLPDGPIRSFIEDELPQYRLDEFVSTLDKTGRFGYSRVLRAALCQRFCPTDFSDFMDHRLILLNLARGVAGSDESRILGAAFLTLLWSHLTVRMDQGRPVYLIVDEAQNFAIPSLTEMLSEGRKYGLRVVLANQYLSQLPTELRSAMTGNIRNWVFFRMGVEDSEAACEISDLALEDGPRAARQPRPPSHGRLLVWGGEGLRQSRSPR